ncbi:MAG: FkbM family methyltransferase, partial [Planctomycetaceae bacterium]|nr:FkbM family methyltransferase [Planctomycetaceae bacterium]
MNLGIVDVIERTLLTTGQWDPIVEHVLRSCLKRGDTFLDVGANIGYFSLLASQLIGDEGWVVSFEPSARALSKLTRHLCLNQCDNVTVCSQAMGQSSGTAVLNWAPSSNIGGSTLNRARPSQGYSERVAVRALDDVCREMDLVPSVIKLDVEGFELFALRGAEQT